MHTVCLYPKQSEEVLANTGCLPSFLFALHGSRQGSANAFLFAVHRRRHESPTSRASLWLLFCVEADANCFALAGTRMRCLPSWAASFLPLCSAREPSWISDQSSKLAAALRCGGGCKLFCLSGRHSKELVANTGCLPSFLFALHGSRHGSPTSRASLRLLFGVRRMQTVCMSDQHSEGLLANTSCRHLPLCFLLAPRSATNDQSSRLGLLFCARR